MANTNDQDVELDDNEDVVEAHDPKNAEKQSIGSIKTSEKAGPTAKARKGDKSNGEAPKTKAGMISVAHDLMSEMTAEDLTNMLDLIMGGNLTEAKDSEYVGPTSEKTGMARKAAVLAHAKKQGYKVNHEDGQGEANPHAKPDISIHYERGDHHSDSWPSGYTVHHDGVAHKDKQLRSLVSGRKLKEDLDSYNVDFTSDLNALVESEATLSQEFKAKTAVIFEAAIKSKLSEEIDRLEEAYATELAEEIASTKADLVEKVDSYLNYVVESWMEENKLAIHNGLRTEIAETFMSKLKDLFVESYVEVPESKVDLFDELTAANEELEETANSAVVKAMKLAEELETYKRDAIIREAAKGLAETQGAKLAALVEDIDFEDAATFAQKVKTIKESYFSKKTAESNLSENTDDDTSEEVSGVMAQYVNAIRKSTN